MKAHLKVLIFDLDGTLADTIPAITEAVNLTLNELGFPPRTEIEIKNAIGSGPRHLISESIPQDAISDDPCIVDKALAIYDNMYSKTYLHTDRLYDGMEKAIVDLSKNYKISVLSNKQDQYVKALVNQLLPEGICLIARGTIDGVPAKPEPIAALELAKELGVSPQECILIGDSDIDIRTAEKAGFDILCVSWGYRSKAHLYNQGAMDIVDSPYDLFEYFN